LHRKKTRLAEIFVFRRLIEPQIAKLSAKNATQANIDELEQIYLEQKNQAGPTKSFGLIDQNFHLALARATGNSTLFQVVQLISNLLLKSREEYLQSPKRRQLSLKGHARILDAIKNRNFDEAEKAMENHLANVEDIIMAQSKNRI
jgi:GntR family transcriptional repressor for pyruvate dehydrogenase complex